MKKTKIVALGFLTVLTCATAIQTNSKNYAFKTVNNVDNNNVTLANFAGDLLSEYYNDVVVANEGKEVCSFEAFCDSYRSSNYDIKEFTQRAISDPQLLNVKESEFKPLPKRAGSSPDESYIIGMDKSYSGTIPHSAFKREPIYRNYYNYYFKTGDIVYETVTKLPHGHNAVLVECDAKMDDGTGYWKTIEAVGSGVNYGFLDDERICKFGVEMLRYTYTLKYNQITKLREFLEAQIGKPYGWWTLDCRDNAPITGYHNSIDSDNWICSTLVEAAYEYANAYLLDIPSYVYPDDLKARSEKLKKLTIDNMFLEIEIVSSTKVKIHNPTPYSVYVEYNTKKCFFDDGRNWKNLSNVKKITDPVQPHGYVEVTISNNWFADSYACRYTKNDYHTSTGDISVTFITVRKGDNKAFVFKQN